MKRYQTNAFGDNAFLATVLVLVFAFFAPGGTLYANTTTDLDVGKSLQQQAGEQLFKIHCARCHGISGDGGEGSNLKRRRLKHAPDDEALKTLIDGGIPGTGMPGNILSEKEVVQLAIYVRFLGDLPVEAPPGDAQQGAELFANKGGCPACHIVAGRGKAIGPELTSIGDQRGLAYLKDALVSPDKSMPSSVAPLWYGAFQGYLSVRLRTKSDEQVQGIRVNEDAFSVQIRDMTGQLRSFSKGDLVEYEKLLGHSAMPGLDFSESDINDLVSYLMSLQEPSH